ncbi:hypothetical protein SH1V18_47740 [Vallitalea longa]|uniref:HD-GYP domain-containing protein n=1 Tax=Vallitalea longa TaxID=2936439 RepID=A0A9W5YFV4_9FIRM|nr:HD domain-containing phosphohydrolase [Vallitalea longa]GKX32294.1 hypothetical protein SH1V18_47740 [Vallitalea longa]
MNDKNIRALSQILDTADHSVRTARISYNLAVKLGLNDIEIFNLLMGALLHDFGKLNLDQEILGIPGPLTKEQYEYIKNHTIFGYKLTKNIVNEEIRKAILNHHERIDGSGYQKKVNITLNEQILGIADVYDALTYRRCYSKKVHSHKEAITLMKKNNNFNNEILDKLASLNIDKKVG